MNELANLGMNAEERQIFDDIDGVISRSVHVGDPLLALEYGANIQRRQALEGAALAKLLYKLQENWGLFEAAGLEDDLLTMADVHMNVRPATAKKYIAMWQNIFENPSVSDDVKQILRGRNIGDLLLLTAAIGEGQLEGENLYAAALAPDKESIRDLVKGARGMQTSSASAIRIYLLRTDKNGMRSGTVYARRGNEIEELFKIKSKYGDLGEKAIARIIAAPGLIEEFS